MESVALLVGATIDPLKKGMKQATALVDGLANDVASMNKKFQDQIVTWGKSGRQADIARLAAAGATKQQLAGLKGLDKQLTRLEAQKKTNEQIKNGLKGLAAVGIGAVVAGLAYSVKAFREVEDANSKLQAALTLTGNTAQGTLGKITAAGSQLSKTTGTSQAAFAKAAGVMASIAGIKGDENLIKATKAAVNLGAALGMDGPAAELLASALQNPEAGMYDLAKANVAFSQSQLDNIRDLQRSGDLLGAQAALLDVVIEKTDGAAEAAGTRLGGKLDILHNAFAKVAATIGEVMAPAIKMAVDWLTQWVQGLDTVANRQAVWDYTAQAAGYIANVVQAIDVAWKSLNVTVSLFHAIAASAFKKVIDLINHMIDQANALGLSLAKIDTTFAKGYEQGAWDHLEKKADQLKLAMLAPWKGGGVVKQLEATKVAGVSAMEAIGKAAKKAGDDIQGALAAALNQEGQRLKESLENPLEKFQRELQRLSVLRNQGGLDAETFQRARTKLVMDFAGAVPQTKIAAGGPLAAGSQAARSALLAYRQNTMNARPQNAIEKIGQKQIEQNDLTNKYLRDLIKKAPQLEAFAGL